MIHATLRNATRCRLLHCFASRCYAPPRRASQFPASPRIASSHHAARLVTSPHIAANRITPQRTASHRIEFIISLSSQRPIAHRAAARHSAPLCPAAPRSTSRRTASHRLFIHFRRSATPRSAAPCNSMPHGATRGFALLRTAPLFNLVPPRRFSLRHSALLRVAAPRSAARHSALPCIASKLKAIR